MQWILRSPFTILFLSLALYTPCAGEEFTPKILPGYINLIKGFKTQDPDLRMQSPRLVIGGQQGKQAPELAVCGHIRVAPAPKDVDPKIIIPVPDIQAGRMPVHKGLPACR